MMNSGTLRGLWANLHRIDITSLEVPEIVLPGRLVMQNVVMTVNIA